MKNLYLLMLVFLPVVSYSQGEYPFQFGIFGTSDIPLKSQMPKMAPSYGLGLNVGYKPIALFPMFIELKGNFGMYDYRTSKETFIFNETSSTETDVTFSSSMHKLQLGVKFYYTNFYRPVRGYVTPQIGYSFMRSRIRIADPADTDDCQPLENRISQRSNGLTYGGELGVEMDLQRLIRHEGPTNNRLYVSVSFLGSAKKLDYINTRYMNEHENVVYSPEHGNHVSEDGRPLTAKFVNVSNNDLHEHKIAEVYSTYLRFINVNIGYVWYF
jgi:hypothetical protein